MEQRDFKGVWIPKEIWLNPNLSAIEKCIFTEISSLDTETHCYASNEHLAEFCQCSVATVTRAIKHLMDLHLIEQVSFDGRTRVLKVSNICMPNQIDEAAPSKCVTSNTYNNIKNKNILSKDNILAETESENNPRNVKKKNLYQKCLDMIHDFTNDARLVDLLVQYLNLLLEKSQHEGKPLYANQFKGMLEKLDTICTDGHYGDVVQQSIVKGYVGFFPVNNYNKQTYVPDTNKAPQYVAREKLKNKDGTLKEY